VPPLVLPPPTGRPATLIGLGQPAGSRIINVMVAEGRLILRVEGGGLPDRLLFLDPATGRHLTTVLVSAP